MASENKLVPKNPNEIVIPIGKANLITTQEEIDGALEIAGRIFRNKKDDNMSETQLGVELAESLAVEEPATEELCALSAEELESMPASKYGRDSYGRSLNKDGSPRKSRSDVGKERGAYASRKNTESIPA